MKFEVEVIDKTQGEGRWHIIYSFWFDSEGRDKKRFEGHDKFTVTVKADDNVIYEKDCQVGKPVPKWNVIDLFKSLNKEEMQELLQSVSLIIDPLSQELIRKACESSPIDTSPRSMSDKPHKSE